MTQPKGRNDVYEVAFVVDPEVRELRDVTLQICQEDDQVDPDFEAQLQVRG